MKQIILFSICFLLAQGTNGQEQQTILTEKIDFRTSSIPLMLNFLRDLKNGETDRNQLVDIFNHPDYDYEFRRYGISSKEPLIDYFMQLNTIDEADIPTLPGRESMLKNNHKHWLAAYENPEYYQELYDRMIAVVTEDDTFDRAYALLKMGLPPDADISSIPLISTMSIGMSFGYAFDGATHVDLMGFDKHNFSVTALPELIAHEIHHIAMNRWAGSFADDFTLEELFIFMFSIEGLAIKFCNNAEGVFSKAIDSTRSAWNLSYLNERFDETYEVFENTLAKIRSGEMSGEELEEQWGKYWLNRHTDEQSPDEEPLLGQSRNYSFGNDLFGSIYDVYGAEALFDCVRHPLKATEYFRQIVAIKK